MCHQHPDEPLVDVHDDNVRFMLMDLDDRHKRKVTGLGALLGGGGTAIVLLVLMSPMMLGLGDLASEALMYVIMFISIGGGALGTLLARKLFYKPRFRAWTVDFDPEADAEAKATMGKVQNERDPNAPPSFMIFDT